MSHTIESIIHELLSENGEQLLKRYHLPFEQELQDAQYYLASRDGRRIHYAPHTISQVALFLNHLLRDNQRQNKRIVDKLDAIDLFNLYYSQHKEHFYTQLNQMNLPFFTLNDTFLVLFVFFLASAIHGVHRSALAEWNVCIKMSLKAFLQIQLVSNYGLWSPNELFLSYHYCKETLKTFSMPERWNFAYNKLYQSFLIVVTGAIHDVGMGGITKRNAAYGQSRAFTEQYVLDHGHKYPKRAPLAREIYQLLEEKDFFGRKKLSAERGVKTVDKWIKDIQEGKFRSKDFPTVHSDQILYYIDHPQKLLVKKEKPTPKKKG